LDYATSAACGQALPFKGALDHLFEEQKPYVPEEAASHAAEKELAAATAAEEQRNALKRKAEEEAQLVEAKKAKAKEAAAAAAEAAQRADTAAGVRGAERPGGHLANTLAAPHCELRLLKEGDLALWSLAPANLRVNKHTVLAKFQDNCGVGSKGSDGFPWAASPKDLVLCGETNSVMTLAKAFKEQYQNFSQVFGYEPFPVGSLPKNLIKSAGADKFFQVDIPDAAECKLVKDCIAAARNAQSLQLLWMVRGVAEKKWVRPRGLAIISTAPLVLAPAQLHKFSK
jgi:hypothetical protein